MLSLLIQINNFSLLFYFLHSLLNLLFYLQSLWFLSSLCVCNFSILSASAHFFFSICVSVLVFLIYLLFVRCLMVFQCSAPPCALTSHLWSAVSHYISQDFCIWLFLVLSFLIISLIHNIYSLLIFVRFCWFFFFFTLCNSFCFHDVWT